jgi:hypothetical protein
MSLEPAPIPAPPDSNDADLLADFAASLRWRGATRREAEAICRRLALVLTLAKAGEPERAAIAAYINKDMVTAFEIDFFRELFRNCDPARLREETDPLPGAGPFTLFRGVVEDGRPPIVDGLSWTTEIWVARFFAMRPWDRAGQPFASEPRREVWRLDDVPSELCYGYIAQWQEVIVDPTRYGLTPILHEADAEVRNECSAAGVDQFFDGMVERAARRAAAERERASADESFYGRA